MARHPIPAVVALTLAAVILPAPAAPGVSANPGGSTQAATTAPPATGGGATFDPGAQEDQTLGDLNLADYPGGSGGTSNGVLTAAQRGEPVGAGGTSGGSSSPFALASAQ